MIKNAFTYIKRKTFKSIIIFFVISILASFSLISLSIKSSIKQTANETFKNITNSFQMEINRNTNPGTPRGGGNLKDSDISKISSIKEIDSFVKRIGAVADLDGLDIIKVENEERNRDKEKIEMFKRSVMLTGVNDSKKETKFVSQEFKLIEGNHLTMDDENKVLVHKELMQKNNLKIGDKITLKSNIYDADNENKAKETVTAQIKGVFDGKNKTPAVISQELYQNNIITSLDIASKVYGNTTKNAPYLDATFFVKGDKNIDSVMKNVKKLNINWNMYNLVKSSNNFPSLQKSISNIYKLSDKLFIGSLVFVGVIITSLLFLWLNQRKKEIAVLLAIGKSKFEIFTQFVFEIIFISIPSFLTSFFLAKFLSKFISNIVLKNATKGITKEIAKAMKGTNLGSGAEISGFNKTITKLDVLINKDLFIYVIFFIIIILFISILISSFNILTKKPKELLIDIE